MILLSASVAKTASWWTSSATVSLGYVNNRRVTQISDETFADGRVGIYIASDEGIADVLVDSFQVFSSVPSMTG